MKLADILVSEPSIDDASNDKDKMDISDNNDTANDNNNDGISVCANCAKEGIGIDMNTCNKCKTAKYCNAACKKKHRKKHKKQCEKRMAELHEEALFKQPPPEEDCPICFLPMPSLGTGRKYNSCCGKVICSGCIVANKGLKSKDLCPFCRTPAPYTHKEIVERAKKRMELNDANAIYVLGICYLGGQFSVAQNTAKALDLYHQAGELGCSDAYFDIAKCYYNGRGVERDQKKAKHYYELAAIKGHTEARHGIGVLETWEGNMNRALKHFTISARGGNSGSVENIRIQFTNGHITKDDYTKAVKSYQAYLNEIKSAQRDEAAACNSDEYKYY